MPRETHFIVRVVVERVDREVTAVPAPTNYSPNVGRGGTLTAELKAGRVVTELASVTTRADTLAALIDMCHAHMELVQDIEATDSRAEVGKRG